MTEIITERLQGLPACRAHIADLRQLHSDPLVMKTLSATGEPHSMETSKASLNRALAHWEAHGFGTWFFRQREDERFVGYCGLRHYLVEGMAESELLYAVTSDCWRQGFGFEMARAVLDHGVIALGLRSVVAFTLSNNLGSRRIMEKLGMTFEKSITHVNLPHLLYRLEPLKASGNLT